MTTTALILRNEAAIRRANALLRLCERETGFVISPVSVPTESSAEVAHFNVAVRGEAREGTIGQTGIVGGTLAAGDSLNRKVMR